MRRFYCAFFLLIILFSNCSDDSQNENARLVGTWRLVADSFNGTDTELTACDFEQTIQFLNDSRVITTGPTAPDPPETPPCEHVQTIALYQIDETEITFFSENDTEFVNPNSTFTILNLSQSTLMVTFNARRTISDSEDSVVIITWERVS